MTGRFNTPLRKPVRVHIIFFLFEVKVYTYLGEVRKIQVTGSSSFAVEPAKSLGGNIAPPPLDRIGLNVSQEIHFTGILIKYKEF